MKYTEMTAAQAEEEAALLRRKLNEYKAMGLALDLSRGKPGKSQLDLTSGMLGVIRETGDCFADDGLDCRNYGLLDGLPEAKKFFSELLGFPAGNIIVAGNSSLNLMYDTVVRCMLYGAGPGLEPWSRQGKIKFLCPAPGYDRHFAICQSLGIEMIPIPTSETGPDMDLVEELVGSDVSIKGIWCVPKFSNPEGYTYSDETVRRFATLSTKAPDFRIFWDNAYAVHELYDEKVPLLDIFAEAVPHDKQDMIFYFASTSKITFPGSGVAIMAASEHNLSFIKPIMNIQTIGFDKINQMRHVKYFGTVEKLMEHMRRHAEILRPKFEIVLDTLKTELGGLGIAEWTEPKGGYFISLNTPDGCAKRVFKLALETGVRLTNAGATFPYGRDPRDRNLRIAPTFPDNDELALAMQILCVCVRLAAIEKLLAA